MSWKYPDLIKFVNSRTIENLTPLYILHNSIQQSNKTGGSDISNKDLLIGYLIESTTGLVTDSSLCLTCFDRDWLNIPMFHELIERHTGKTCIIDITSESWGPTKISTSKRIFSAWIDDYTNSNSLNDRICIDSHKVVNLSIKVKVSIV